MTSGVYAAVTAALVVAVVAVAYGSAAPQLGVAEFAPAARSQVESPPTTAGDETRSGGTRGGRRSTTTTAPPASATTAPDGSAGAAPTTRVSRSRSCVGDPPRQTDDPMSPACLAAIFEGDNGGATSRGISETEIRVAVPLFYRTAGDDVAMNALFEYFNQRFEFYGRRLVPIYPFGSASDPVAARSLVAEMASQEIFAALTGVEEVSMSATALPVELARHQVVTITRATGMVWSDRTLYDPWHPYLWSVYPSAEDVQANLADFACRSLAGRPARHARDVSLHDDTRRFGVVAASGVVPPIAAPLIEALTDCTGERPLRADVAGSAGLRGAMEQLRAGGATTLLCVCEDDYSFFAFSAAGGIGFYPEWLITPPTWNGCEGECGVQNYRSSLSPPIMLNPGPRTLPAQARMWFGPLAPLLAAPGANFNTVMGRAELLYTSLLVLASGVQAAGPNLTPSTFAAGLMSAQFPNPGAGQAPFWQPGAGFGPGDHSFYDDYHVGWWSDEAEAMEQPQGAKPKGSWCYLDLAARFRLGTYPADADSRLFRTDLPCR